ncbi:hypothetical protein NDU88_006061 [Pleurodeles waltl]|uniref:Uncharacterized protein n=1 Tax=Pleurodeles waltl TaxID=8319 RepID=A0AAV7LN71_PLEWA|nr:hypothetical protein NDU88_006061 [Pleurodeles waltl]
MVSPKVKHRSLRVSAGQRREWRWAAPGPRGIGEAPEELGPINLEPDQTKWPELDERPRRGVRSPRVLTFYTPELMPNDKSRERYLSGSPAKQYSQVRQHRGKGHMGRKASSNLNCKGLRTNKGDACLYL